MRKIDVKNYVAGRWVLTVKRDKNGNFEKCKARWVLRGFQDKQIFELQTDAPTSTRPGFRLQCQAAANRPRPLPDERAQRGEAPLPPSRPSPPSPLFPPFSSLVAL